MRLGATKAPVWCAARKRVSSSCASRLVRNARLSWRRRPPLATSRERPTTRRLPGSSDGRSCRWPRPKSTQRWLPHGYHERLQNADIGDAKAIYQDFRGAPGRIRTCDARFRKPTLYPLSYGSGASSLVGPFRIRDRPGRGSGHGRRLRPWPRSHTGGASAGVLDQTSERVDDEPDVARALAVGLAGGGVTGEPVQRPLAGLELERAVGDARRRRTRPGRGRRAARGRRRCSGGHASAQSPSQVGVPSASLVNP